MPGVVALIPVNTVRGPLGLPSRINDLLAGKAVLRHVVQRVAAVPLVEAVVLVTRSADTGIAATDFGDAAKPVSIFVDDQPGGNDNNNSARDDDIAFCRSSRAWSLTAWRGGLGGATCYDELLPAAPLARAMKHHDAESALLVGADWPLVDVELCQRVLALHRENVEAMQLTFTQAPPGLAGVAASYSLLTRLAEHGASLGRMLAYNPAHAQADPIGRDVCVQIAPTVRSCGQRFTYDTPRGWAVLDALAAKLGGKLNSVEAAEVVATVAALEQGHALPRVALPQQITLELTPRRDVAGPITPQHHVDLSRPDMSLDLALRLVAEMGAVPDVALTLGGLGDAMLHPQWEAIVTTARDAGVLAVNLETDLLGSRDAVARLLDTPVDVISVRMNADTAAVYEKTMGSDKFATLIANMEWLLNTRNKAGRRLPWIVPRMVKTPQTLPDMETFFDRWMHFTGHAVIEPATPGRGIGGDLMPVLSPWRMASPRRGPCRQLGQRMSILADGTVALCDQDWLGRAKLGNATDQTLAEIWRRVAQPANLHAVGAWNQLELCANCEQWHRP